MEQKSLWLRAFFSYPPTWLVFFITFVADGWLINRFHPTPIPLLILCGITLLLLLLWPLLLRRSTYFGRRVFRRLERLSRQDEGKLDELRKELQGLGAEQGVVQLRLLREKLDSLAEVLGKRLGAGELTYGRYLGTAEQVYLASVDNLREVVVALKSVSTIDPEMIDARLREKGRDQQEVATLQRRKGLYQEQKEKVKRLLVQNETALTALYRTATAFSDTRTGTGDAEMGAAEAIEELERLARGAGRYAGS